MNQNRKPIPSWLWTAGALVVVIFMVSSLSRSCDRAKKEGMQKVLMRDYGDAIQDYRSDPVRYRDRIQQLVREGKVSQQEADEAVEMTRKMSQAAP